MSADELNDEVELTRLEKELLNVLNQYVYDDKYLNGKKIRQCLKMVMSVLVEIPLSQSGKKELVPLDEEAVVEYLHKVAPENESFKLNFIGYKICSKFASVPRECPSVESIKEVLRQFVAHHECEDPYYSCPLSPDGCGDDTKGNKCSCGLESRLEKQAQAIHELCKGK